MAKNDFQYGGWNSFTLQCGTWLLDDMPLNSLKRLSYWNSTSGFDFDGRPYHRIQHVILHQSAKIYAHGRKMTSCRFSRWRISAILDFRGPIMGSLKSPCATSYRSSMDTVALNCLVFEKIAFLHFIDRETDEQTDSTEALSRSRCRERRINNCSWCY